MASEQVTDQLPPFLETSPHGMHTDAFRPDAMGVSGAVVANHPLATQAGLRMLQKGGNAVDAAVAIGFALTMAEPQSSGIGGDGFVMVYMKDRAQVEVANGTGPAPLGATRERYRDGIPDKGMMSVSVPGIVDALLSAHSRFGRLSLRECLEPAIDLAENGAPLSHRQARLLESERAILDYETSRAVYAPDGQLLRAGDVVRNPNLAKSMQLIADHGRDAFYDGPIAREIGRFSEANGGVLSLEDFRRFRVRWQQPISTTYRGHHVYEAPPNSSGHLLLQELNLVEHFDLKSFGAMSADAIHVMVEAKRLAFADREAYTADPDFVDVPIEGLISKAYAAERVKQIDPGRALRPDEITEGDPWGFQEDAPSPSKRFYRRGQDAAADHASDTTHFCVVDRWGNAVSELQSLQTNFGSAVIAGDTGILLNNRMTYWHLEENHIDALAPGKRVRHTMNPVMVFAKPAEEHGALQLVCGTPGADTQVQTNLQLLVHALDFGFTAGECVEAPRWAHMQDRMVSGYPHSADEDLRMERRHDPGVLEVLRRRGHRVATVGAWEGTGSAGMIQVHPKTGALMAAADPRRDGHALVW